MSIYTIIHNTINFLLVTFFKISAITCSVWLLKMTIYVLSYINEKESDFVLQFKFQTSHTLLKHYYYKYYYNWNPVKQCPFKL